MPGVDPVVLIAHVCFAAERLSRCTALLGVRWSCWVVVVGALFVCMILVDTVKVNASMVAGKCWKPRVSLPLSPQCMYPIRQKQVCYSFTVAFEAGMVGSF